MEKSKAPGPVSPPRAAAGGHGWRDLSGYQYLVLAVAWMGWVLDSIAQAS